MSLNPFSVTDLRLEVHCVSKKFPPLNSLYLYQNLVDFQKFCTAGKRMKFATENLYSFPPHLHYVATLPWEVKSPNLF